MSTKTGAIWDEVQGGCDATRVERALDAVTDKQLVLDGWTPLHYVCEHRSVDDVQRAMTIGVLIKFGIDVNATDENGWTALHLLCKNKHLDDLTQSMHALVLGGANASLATTDSKKVALHLLCENGSVSIAAALWALVQATSNVNAVDADGSTPLHYLTENSYLTTELLTTILAAKANPNIQNQFLSTPFHNLCQHSGLSIALIQLMLHQYKANPNLPNNIGNTAFHYACENDALTLDILHSFIDSKRVNLTATNALGKTALELIPPHKHDCLAVAHKIGAPSLGAASTLTSDATKLAIAGGEDPSELPSASLAQHLATWNASLPPFDMAFYNAVCCEQAFADLYEHVQDVSAQICDSPSDLPLFKAWEQALAKWRSQLVVAFAALVPPELWDSYADKYKRAIPSDIANVRAKIVDVWAASPSPALRRQRLEALDAIF